MSSLPRSTPEAQGVASSALLALLAEAGESIRELHSIMLVRHGHVIAEGWWTPYASEHPHILFSLSKSFTSTAAGFAVSEGLLSLDDTVLPFFPEEAPENPSENLKAMRIRDLLAMATGNEEDTLGSLLQSEDWVKAFLSCPVQRVPGTHFVYNSGATYMVSAIVQKVTQQTVLDYLTPRLLKPLGITGATWENCPRGINAGGWGLSVKTEDIAKFGQIYLQYGVWEGEQLLPKGWTEEATRIHIANGDNPNSDWNQGYGFQFWRARHGAYRGDGAFGQYCVVMQEQDAVVAITAGVADMQGVLNLIWKHLLPAFQDSPLTDDAENSALLAERLSNLKMLLPVGEATAPRAAELSGRTYHFEENAGKIEAITFHFGDGGTHIEIQQGGNTYPFVCGVGGTWVFQSTLFGRPPHLPEALVAVAGAWSAEDNFTVKLCVYETPFCPILDFRFEGDSVFFDDRPNVAFGTTELPQIVGHYNKGESN